MRVSSQGTDLEADFFVSNDSQRCEEFVLIGRPISNNDEHPLKECYVVVQENTHVAVIGHISGTIKQARIDLVVDGSWVGERTIEAPKQGLTKAHSRRRIEFKAVNSIIEDAQSIEENDGPKLIEGELTAVQLPPDLDPYVLVGDGETFGVGSLLVIISVEQDYTPGYLPMMKEHPDCTLGNWATREHEIRNPGIVPTHSMKLRNINDNSFKQKANKAQRRFKEPKFGFKPFAKLVFNYRSREALTAAGVIPAPMRIYPVQREKAQLAPITSPPRKSRSSNSGGLFVTPSPPKASFPWREISSTSPAIPTWSELIAEHAQERVERLAFIQRQHGSTNNTEHQTQVSMRDVVGIKEEPDDGGVIIQVAGIEHDLPSIKIICDMIPKHGLSMHKVLRLLLPNVAKDMRSEASKIFLHYMRDFSALRYDQHGKQLVIKRCHLSELKQQSTLVASAFAQKRPIDQCDSMDLSSKRRRVEASSDLDAEPAIKDEPMD